jgi:hypothetical protein
MKGLTVASKELQMATSSAGIRTDHCRRKAARQPFSGKVVIGSTLNESSVGTLGNISPFGCNVISSADWLRMGRVVSLNVGQRRTIQAIVRWTRDGSAGLEFLRPIDLAESEWLEGDAS